MSIVPIGLGAFLVLIVVMLVRRSAQRQVRQAVPYAAAPQRSAYVRSTTQPRPGATAAAAVLLAVAVLTAVTAAVLLVDDAMQTRVKDPFDRLPEAPGAAR